MSYIRVILRGVIGVGEVWSVAPAFNETTNVAGWDQAAGQNAANAVAAVVVPNLLKNTASNAGRGTQVRVERRSDDHTLLGAAEAAWAGFTAPTQNPDKPAQSSIVFSLRSNVPGSRGRGRLYWPALSAGISSSTLRLDAAGTLALATAASSYLNLIETALKEQLHPSPSLIDYRLCVVSRTSGVRTDVTRIEVGDLLDVQRRRRDRLAENYSSVAYA